VDKSWQFLEVPCWNVYVWQPKSRAKSIHIKSGHTFGRRAVNIMSENEINRSKIKYEPGISIHLQRSNNTFGWFQVLVWLSAGCSWQKPTGTRVPEFSQSNDLHQSQHNTYNGIGRYITSYRQTDICVVRQTPVHSDRHLYRQTDTCTVRQTPVQSDRHLYSQTDTCTDRQTPVQSDRHLYTQTDTCTVRQTPVQTDRHLYRQTDTCTDRQTPVQSDRQTLNSYMLLKIALTKLVHLLTNLAFQDSITTVPHDQWNPGYLSAAPQCVKAGSSCILSTYTNPTDGLIIQAENNTDDNGHGSVRPPYLLDHTVRLAYINRGQVRYITNMLVSIQASP
jgi:hypothetical protein